MIGLNDASSKPQAALHDVAQRVEDLRNAVSETIDEGEEILGLLIGGFAQKTEPGPVPPYPVGLVPLLADKVADIHNLLDHHRGILRRVAHALQQPPPPVATGGRENSRAI